MASSSSRPPLTSNLTELVAVLKLVEQYPDFPKNFIPPAYTNPNYVPPYRGTPLLVILIVTIVICIVITVARLIIRQVRGLKRWGLDDWTIIPSLLLVLALSSTLLLTVKRGCVGYHTYDCSLDELRFAYQFKFITLILGYAGATAVRASVVLFLWRLSVAGDSAYRRKLIGTLILLAILFLGSTIMQLFVCKPMNAQWNLNQRIFEPSKCHWEWQLVVGWICVYGVTDFWILYLPVELIWKLNRPKRDRFGIIFLFLLGGIASIMALVKIKWIKGTYFSYDQTWNSSTFLILTQVEHTISLVVTSLPALNFLLIKAIPRWMHNSDRRPGRVEDFESDPSDRNREIIIEKTVEISADNDKASKDTDTTETRVEDRWKYESSIKSMQSRASSFHSRRYPSNDQASFDLVIQAP